MNKALLDQAEAAVIELLQDVRPILMDAYGQIEFTTKADKSAVTELDKTVEERLRDVLRPLSPNVGILGEELGQEGNKGTFWLLDPIDGTEQFIRGLPGCKNLVCLMENGEPVWALMYMFVTDELFLARVGEGVSLNGKKIEMKYRPLQNCWIDFEANPLNTSDVELLSKLREKVFKVSRMHDFASLVTGKLDGMIFKKPTGGIWDWGPRVLLYKEAGGKIAHVGRNSFDWTLPDKLLIGAHAKNFDELMKLVA